MKVYFQRLKSGKGCTFDTIDGLKSALYTEIDEYYYFSDKTEEEKEVMVENISNEIKKLKKGERIQAFGFEWGISEMTKAEYDNLGEFEGW